MSRKPARVAAVSALLFAALACGGGEREDACGDGVRGPTEQCDPSVAADAASCTGACTWTFCGDGAVQAMEECDPPDGLGCEPRCRVNRCGNGTAAMGEVCLDAEPPLVVQIAPPLVAEDSVDVDGDGDLDLLLVNAEGVSVFRYDEGAFTLAATLSLPGVVAATAYDSGPVRAIVAITDEDGVNVWRFSPKPDGWLPAERLVAEGTFAGPALDVRAHGSLALLVTALGWHTLHEREIQRIADTLAGMTPSAPVSSGWPNPPGAEPDLVVAEGSVLRRLSFVNWQNTPFEDARLDVVGHPMVSLVSAPDAPGDEGGVVAVSAAGELVTANLGQEDGGTSSYMPVSPPLIAVAAGHLDGDLAIPRLGSALASEDYAYVSAEGVRVVLNDGTGMFGNVWDPPLTGVPDELRMADVDGDGWSDLLVRDEAAGTLTVWVSRP